MRNFLYHEDFHTPEANRHTKNIPSLALSAHFSHNCSLSMHQQFEASMVYLEKLVRTAEETLPENKWEVGYSSLS